jgi:S-adenosylmethionine hydrolase
MNIGLAINQGSFSEHFHIDFGSEWSIEFEKISLVM